MKFTIHYSIFVYALVSGAVAVTEPVADAEISVPSEMDRVVHCNKQMRTAMQAMDRYLNTLNIGDHLYAKPLWHKTMKECVK